MLNDTEHIKNVTVTNTSPLKVVFKWSFLENAINFESKEDDEGIHYENVTALLFMYDHLKLKF